MNVKVIWHVNYNGYTVICDDPSLSTDLIEEELVDQTADCYDADGNLEWHVDVGEKEHTIAYIVRHMIKDMGETKPMIEVEIDEIST